MIHTFVLRFGSCFYKPVFVQCIIDRVCCKGPFCSAVNPLQYFMIGSVSNRSIVIHCQTDKVGLSRVCIRNFEDECRVSPGSFLFTDVFKKSNIRCVHLISTGYFLFDSVIADGEVNSSVCSCIGVCCGIVIRCIDFFEIIVTCWKSLKHYLAVMIGITVIIACDKIIRARVGCTTAVGVLTISQWKCSGKSVICIIIIAVVYIQQELCIAKQRTDICVTNFFFSGLCQGDFIGRSITFLILNCLRNSRTFISCNGKRMCWGFVRLIAIWCFAFYPVIWTCFNHFNGFNTCTLTNILYRMIKISPVNFGAFVIQFKPLDVILCTICSCNNRSKMNLVFFLKHCIIFLFFRLTLVDEFKIILVVVKIGSSCRRISAVPVIAHWWRCCIVFLVDNRCGIHKLVQSVLRNLRYNGTAFVDAFTCAFAYTVGDLEILCIIRYSHSVNRAACCTGQRVSLVIFFGISLTKIIHHIAVSRSDNGCSCFIGIEDNMHIVQRCMSACQSCRCQILGTVVNEENILSVGIGRVEIYCRRRCFYFAWLCLCQLICLCFRNGWSILYGIGIKLIIACGCIRLCLRHFSRSVSRTVIEHDIRIGFSGIARYSRGLEHIYCVSAVVGIAVGRCNARPWWELSCCIAEVVSTDTTAHCAVDICEIDIVDIGLFLSGLNFCTAPVGMGCRNYFITFGLCYGQCNAACLAVRIGQCNDTADQSVTVKYLCILRIFG